jgi:hypothetical protein
MKCISREEDIELFEDIHKGVWITLIMAFDHQKNI